MKTFNINSNVKVKLTKFGKEHHRQRHIDFWNSLQKDVVYLPPMEDQDGYCEFQLWKLMEIFGSFCVMGGGELPFETIILIEDKDLT